MRATIAWSEALLTPAENVLFRRLAVFVGGCTFEVAEAVCAAPAGATPLDLDLLEGMTELVEQSLVQQREEEGEPRFVLLHVIREYALERLESSGEAESLCRAHAIQLLALANRANHQKTGSQTVVWRDRLEREHDNLRAALAWARDHGEAETGLRLAQTLFWFWRRRGHLREGRRWLEELLAAGHVDALETDTGFAKLRAQSLVNSGTLALMQGAYLTAETEIEQGRALALAVGDQRTARVALTSLGRIASAQGDVGRATAYYSESLALAREGGDRHAITTLLVNLASVALHEGDFELAAARTTEGLALARELGDHDQVALCLNNLGVIARRRGDLSQSEAFLREALVGAWKLGDPHRCATVLESLAETAVAIGRPERAARLLGAATAVRETVGVPIDAYDQAREEQEMAPAQEALGQEQWAATYTSGRALSLEQAVAEALAPGLD
jgi:non-specific serine/threonine protein kinase